MATILGIHVGHHASCAVAKDGKIIAAIQQERLTGQKHDGEEALSNRLPIAACLNAANARMDELDCIVSCFQSVAESSFGLHKPLIEDGFNLFDPFDRRHFVVSHHLAHAWHTFAGSGFDKSAVLIADLAGSSTVDGLDFTERFSDWYRQITSSYRPQRLRTECLSIYTGDSAGLSLILREYGIPHIQPLSFVWNAASLYDNVSRRIFGDENAHGQLMALAALGDPIRQSPPFHWTSMIAMDGPNLVFRNDWQHLVPQRMTPPEEIALAAACQEALARSLQHSAEQACLLTGNTRLAVAGGTFLNILANTRIANDLGHSNFFVPSAPNDAGIAIGCAFLGTATLIGTPTKKLDTDRVGPIWLPKAVIDDLGELDVFIRREPYDASKVATELEQGGIIGRWCGRSEFGPRALGGRSILATPHLSSSKDRLNLTKDRQPWRPVAPIVPLERARQFFEGPFPSPWMTFAHRIREEFASELPALNHPDGTTRVQTLSRDEDSDLYDLLELFGEHAGWPILVNTSLNGRGDPIVERPSEALKFYLRSIEIDSLVIGDSLVRRRPLEDIGLMRIRATLAPNTLVTFTNIRAQSRVVIAWKTGALDINREVLSKLGLLNGWTTIRDLISGLRDDCIPDSEIWILLTGGALDIQYQ